VNESGVFRLWFTTCCLRRARCRPLPLLVGCGGFLRWGRAVKSAVVVEPSINTTSSVEIFLHHKMMWCKGRVSFDKPTAEPT